MSIKKQGKRTGRFASFPVQRAPIHISVEGHISANPFAAMPTKMPCTV